MYYDTEHNNQFDTVKPIQETLWWGDTTLQGTAFDHSTHKCPCDQETPFTVTPFKFVAVKVSGFDIITYSLPFNFVVSYQNYFTVSYTNVVFFSTQIKVGVC